MVAETVETAKESGSRPTKTLLTTEKILLLVFAVVLIFSLLQAVQLLNLSGTVTTAAAATGQAAAPSGSTGAVDMTGWTKDEKMNYEMHGIIPARASGGSPSSGGGMVGGC